MRPGEHLGRARQPPEPECRVRVFDRLAQLSAEPIGGTPQATAAYMREEIERWRNVIKAANVKLE